MKKILSGSWLLLLLVCSSSLMAQQKTIVETAVSAGNFKTLVTAVKAAGLVDTLNGHKKFTVFAPTDEAFAKVDAATLESLLKPESKGALTQILTYHVLAGSVKANAAYGLNSAKTVNGQSLPLNLRGATLSVGEATITVTDIECSNGVIHVIDAVLMPSLDTIPAVAEKAGKFKTLLAAVGAAGLAEVLSSDGPFTVFAPTDEAFAALPAGTVESLVKPENKQKLVDILKYHVVAGRVSDVDAVKAGKARTLLGRSVSFQVSAKGLMVNEAKVIGKNVTTANGMVHIIDSVLLPTSMTQSEMMTALTNAVNRGSVSYNSGHHSQCCEIYMDVLTSISEAGVESADDHTMAMLTSTLKRAKKTHSSMDRAWVLRRGIDMLYSRMSNLK